MKPLVEQFPPLKMYANGDYLGYMDFYNRLAESESTIPVLQFYAAQSVKRTSESRRSHDLFRKVAENPNADLEYRAVSLLNMGLSAIQLIDPGYSDTCLTMCKQLGGLDAITLTAWAKANSELASGGRTIKEFGSFIIDNDSHQIAVQLYCLILDVLDLQVEFTSYWKHRNGVIPEDARILSVAIEYLLLSQNLTKATDLLVRYREHAKTVEMQTKADYFALRIRVLKGDSLKSVSSEVEKILASVRYMPRHKAGAIQRFCSGLRSENILTNVLVSRRHGMIGESPQLEQIRELIDLYANSDLNVLIRGDSGTGKELVAIALHQNSRRRDQSFVPVNCFHLGTQLAEARLFGHRKGAFTGASQDAPGFVHEAHGGTLFLDEVGELPVEAQANLFRFLDSGQFRRVGSTEQEKANVRVIAASNQDLSQDSRFRHELYHRLGTVIIDLPPLAERGDDVLHIARCRVAELNVLGGITKQLSADSERKLLGHDWPGNVRELLNVIDRAWHASSQEIAGDVLRFDRGVPLHMVASLGWAPDLQPDVVDLDESVNRYTARLVQEMLERCNRDTAEAARRLNISERTVYRWMKRNEQFAGSSNMTDTTGSPQA